MVKIHAIKAEKISRLWPLFWKNLNYVMNIDEKFSSDDVAQQRSVVQERVENF